MDETTDTQPDPWQAPVAPISSDAPSAGLPAESPTERPPAHHRRADLGGLRVVIVVWCFWLLGAWAAAWLSDTSVPRVRWMLFAGAIGLMLVWPAFRLSERVDPGQMSRGALQVLLDWLALVTVYQAVIWSLHLIAYWPIQRGVWLDAAVLAWSLLSALIVAVARLWPGAPARWIGMTACLALVFAEPLAVWLSIQSGGAGWPMRISPVQALYELTGVPVTREVPPWDRRIMLTGLVAVAGWAALGAWALGAKLLEYRQRHDP